MLLTKEQYQNIIIELEKAELSDRQIAKKVGCNNATVSMINNGETERASWMWEGEFPIRKGRVKWLDDEEVIEKFEELQDIEKTQEFFTCSKSTLERILRRNGYRTSKKVWAKY